MRGDVAEAADAEHAPHLDQIAVAHDAPERRHRQRHAEKHQRPEAGAVDQIVERARAVQDRLRVKQRLGEREQQQEPACRCATATSGRACRAKAAKRSVSSCAPRHAPGRLIERIGAAAQDSSALPVTPPISSAAFAAYQLFRTAQCYRLPLVDRASIFQLIRFVTTVHKVGRNVCAGAGTKPATATGEGGAEKKLELRHAGPLRGGHRCCETWYAHCSCSLCPCSALPRSPTTSGSIAALIKILPANGAAAPKTVAWLRPVP